MASVDEENWLYMAASVLDYAVHRSNNSYLIRLHLVRIHRLLCEYFFSYTRLVSQN